MCLQERCEKNFVPPPQREAMLPFDPMLRVYDIVYQWHLVVTSTAFEVCFFPQKPNVTLPGNHTQIDNSSARFRDAGVHLHVYSWCE